MIGKVIRGKDVRRLLYYLFGPGRANEHVDPRLVAGFRLSGGAGAGAAAGRDAGRAPPGRAAGAAGRGAEGTGL